MYKKVKYVVIVVAVLMVISTIVGIALAKNKDKKPKELSISVSLTYFDDQPTKGKMDAPVSIVEFGDFKCPGCQYFAETIFPNLVRDYIDSGKANFKFVNYPFLGPDSLTAAAAGEYVAKKSPNEFWTYYEAIYKNQKNESLEWATIDYLIEIAKGVQIHVDYADMERSLKSGEYSEVVNRDLSFTRDLGIRGTPTLVVNGMVFGVGGLSYEEIKSTINNIIDKRVGG
ncbi:DsbA family protein [Paenibacillus periandrae]|uniref:DsbA family protein n=1 Tax=Paenibacillus periandrae TaxID=1761741 RepID=UPI001F09BE16|nr:DsbA family protein [Paenibacillus periandrae]